MQSFCRALVDFECFFGCAKCAQMMLRTFCFNRCAPPRSIARYTFETRGVSARNRNVLHVLSLCRASQIFPAIVQTIFIFMINLMRRPATSHYGPDDSVRLVEPTIETDQNAIIRRCASSNVPDLTSPTCRLLPSKLASERIIIKKTTQLRWCGLHIQNYTFKLIRMQY